MIADAMETRLLPLTGPLDPGITAVVTREDSDPLDRLYRANHKLLWRLALRMTGDPALQHGVLGDVLRLLRVGQEADAQPKNQRMLGAEPGVHGLRLPVDHSRDQALVLVARRGRRGEAGHRSQGVRRPGGKR